MSKGIAAPAVASDDLAVMKDAVSVTRATVGARWATLATYADANDKLRVSAEKERSDRLDTDVAAESVVLTRSMASLEAARSVFARIQAGGLFQLLK
mgnify:CR=1 FL=1